MSHHSEANSHQDRTVGPTQSSTEIPSDPIGFYTTGLGFGLMVTAVAHMGLISVLSRIPSLVGLQRAINALAVPFYGAFLGGLGVCALLMTWFKARRIAAATTAILVILWLVKLVGYAQAGNAVTTTLIVLLALGIPVLLALWFLRPMERMGAIIGSIVWFLFWLGLTVALRQVLAGMVLLFSLATSGAVFLFGLYVAAGALLPLPGREDWSKALDYLRDFYLGLNYPAYVVVDTRYQEDRVEERVPGRRFSEFAAAPGLVISDCDQAVVISSGTKFKGVQGPGVTFTSYADQVVQTIDLRPQLRAFFVEALTKDGIKVRVLAFTPVRIDAGEQQPRIGQPLPYHKRAAVRAFYAQRMEHEAGSTTRRAWDDLAGIVAERVLQNILSSYDFDELYGPYQAGGVPPRKVIAGRFVEEVRKELKPHGIHLVGGGISDIQPADPEIYLKRVRSWQAEWERRVLLRQAKGQTEWLRILERARAEAQADLILTVGRQLEELSNTRTEFRPDVALKLLVTVVDELMVNQPTLGQIIPGETLQALMGIRQALKE